MPENSRSFTRVSFSTRAEVNIGGKNISGEVSDVSMKGIHLCCDTEADAGTECKVRIFLGEEDPLVIRAKGKIARKDDTGISIEFTDVFCDSYSHLKNIVIYNTEEPDQTEQEFSSHMGIHSE